MNQGWIKLHRQLLEWEWYDDINTKVLFLHLLLKANHKDKKYKGDIVRRGELLTGLSLLSKQTGLSVQNIRTSLSRLKSTNEITSKSSSKGTVIQIVNYDLFQEVTSEVTSNQQTTNKQVTTNKNVKNKKKFIVPTLEEVKEYCTQRKNDVDPDKWHSFYSAKGWMVGKNKMKDWKAAVRTWETKTELPPIPKQVASIALQGSQDTLNSLLNKGYTIEQIKQAVK